MKNGGVPNECHPVRKTKNAEGGRRAKYEESVGGWEEARGKSHMSTSRISVEIIALLRCSYSSFYFFSIKLSNKVGRFLVPLTLKSVLNKYYLALHLLDLNY